MGKIWNFYKVRATLRGQEVFKGTLPYCDREATRDDVIDWIKYVEPALEYDKLIIKYWNSSDKA